MFFDIISGDCKMICNRNVYETKRMSKNLVKKSIKEPVSFFELNIFVIISDKSDFEGVRVVFGQLWISLREDGFNLRD